MNRARKKKVFQAEVAPVVIDDTTGTTEPCPAGPAGPGPSQPPPSPPVPEEANLQSYVSEMDMLVERRTQAFINRNNVQTRWNKTAITYFNNRQRWLWGSAKSEQLRVIVRLQNADDKLRDARAHCVECRRECSLHRTRQRAWFWAAVFPEKLDLPLLALMASRRLLEFRVRKNAPKIAFEAVDKDEAHDSGITNLIVSKYGLAEGWKWFSIYDASGERCF